MSEHNPPLIRSSSAGSVNDMCSLVAADFRQRNPGMEVRLVHAPAHRNDPSKVIRRRLVGYRPVTVEEAGEFGPMFASGDQIRVGDTVLMAVKRETHAALASGLTARALEERQRVGREYYDTVKANQGVGPSGEVRVGIPTGKVEIREEEREITIRNGEEGST